jgi:hypothetical protein
VDGDAKKDVLAFTGKKEPPQAAKIEEVNDGDAVVDFAKTEEGKGDEKVVDEAERQDSSLWVKARLISVSLPEAVVEVSGDPSFTTCACVQTVHASRNPSFMSLSSQHFLSTVV